MYVDGWQANATGEDAGAVLKRYGAEEVKQEDGPFSDWPAWTWRSYVDTDEDLVNLTLIGAWYNDRGDGQLADLREVLTRWLADNPRGVTERRT